MTRALVLTCLLLQQVTPPPPQTTAPPPQTTPPPAQTTPPPAQTTPPPQQTAPPPQQSTPPPAPKPTPPTPKQVAPPALQQVAPPGAQPSVITKSTEPPVRNTEVLFYDDVVLFAARTFSEHREAPGQPDPGFFVHSKERNRWLQIVAISTAGARLGRSWSDDPNAQKKLRTVPFGWDFTTFAGRPYLDIPLKTSGSIAFPDKITFDPDSGLYELRFFSVYGVPTAETVLFIRRTDLVEAFLRR